MLINKYGTVCTFSLEDDERIIKHSYRLNNTHIPWWLTSLPKGGKYMFRNSRFRFETLWWFECQLNLNITLKMLWSFPNRIWAIHLVLYYAVHIDALNRIQCRILEYLSLNEDSIAAIGVLNKDLSNRFESVVRSHPYEVTFGYELYWYHMWNGSQIL